jgi:hypothetical protein
MNRDPDDASVARMFAELDQLLARDVATAASDLPVLVRPTSRGPVRILTGMQCQGDIIVTPLTGDADPMPYFAQPEPDGTVIQLIEDGNGHQLRVDNSAGGQVRWCRRPSLTDIGLLDVTRPAVVYVEQVKGLDAHHPLGIGPGRYLIGRQRELANPPRWWQRTPRIRTRTPLTRTSMWKNR